MRADTPRNIFTVAFFSLVSLVGLNLLWLVGTVFVVTAFPALGGLYYATNKIAHDEYEGIRAFFVGFKKYFWISWVYGLVTIVPYLFMLWNISFYNQFTGNVYAYVQALYIALAVLWTCIQLYVFPFILEQQQPNVFIAIKNAFSVFIKFMPETLFTFFVFLMIAAVSVILFPLWFLLTVSLLVFMANWRTIDLIRKMGMPS